MIGPGEYEHYESTIKSIGKRTTKPSARKGTMGPTGARPAHKPRTKCSGKTASKATTKRKTLGAC